MHLRRPPQAHDISHYATTAGTTSITNHITYDSFGHVIAEINPSDTQDDPTAHLFGFTGRPFDEATGLQNNLNRWYDAAIGRWLSEDPIGFQAGDANPSRYVANDPTGLVDPSGLAKHRHTRSWPTYLSAPFTVVQDSFRSIRGVSELNRKAKEVQEEHFAKGVFGGDIRSIRYADLYAARSEISELAEVSVEVTAVGLGGGFLTKTATASSKTMTTAASTTAPKESGGIRKWIGRFFKRSGDDAVRAVAENRVLIGAADSSTETGAFAAVRRLRGDRGRDRRYRRPAVGPKSGASRPPVGFGKMPELQAHQAVPPAAREETGIGQLRLELDVVEVNVESQENVSIHRWQLVAESSLMATVRHTIRSGIAIGRS